MHEFMVIIFLICSVLAIIAIIAGIMFAFIEYLESKTQFIISISLFLCLFLGSGGYLLCDYFKTHNIQIKVEKRLEK